MESLQQLHLGNTYLNEIFLNEFFRVKEYVQIRFVKEGVQWRKNNGTPLVNDQYENVGIMTMIRYLESSATLFTIKPSNGLWLGHSIDILYTSDETKPNFWRVKLQWVLRMEKVHEPLIHYVFCRNPYCLAIESTT